MKKNQWIKGIIILVVMVLLTACKSSNSVISNGKKVNTSNLGHLHCTRVGSLDDGTTNLEYDLYYKGEVLNLLISKEEVTSSSSEVLDTYENAYRGIHKYYEGLEYYDTEVVRTDESVKSTITINYEKIDIDKLLDIEGEEDNIFENKVPKVEKWKDLASQFGTKCEEVSE